MGLATLGLNLTGDLLPWDQNSYWATGIRTRYLAHTPVAGPWLAKLALGGPQFGTFTLTRFLALHAGVSHGRIGADYAPCADILRQGLEAVTDGDKGTVPFSLRPRWTRKRVPRCPKSGQSPARSPIGLNRPCATRPPA